MLKTGRIRFTNNVESVKKFGEDVVVADMNVYPV